MVKQASIRAGRSMRFNRVWSITQQGQVPNATLFRGESLSGDNIVGDIPVDIGKAKVATGVVVGEPLVVES